MEFYSSSHGQMFQIDRPALGCWINMADPSSEQCQKISAAYNIDLNDLCAALDEEESSRVLVEDNYTMILVDIPNDESSGDALNYETIPLGILFNSEVIITICKEKTPILNAFASNQIRSVNCRKQLRFIYQILFQTALVYQNDLRAIDRKRQAIESKAESTIKNSELIALHQLNSSLVYFATSLQANGGVLDRLQRYVKIRKYPEDQVLLEDVIVENKQAIEMTAIYRDIINGTQDLLASISDNRLNNVMKYLTSITLVMAVPTIISGFYGMNVNEKWMPLADTPYGFGIICLITLLICILILFLLKKKNML